MLGEHVRDDRLQVARFRANGNVDRRTRAAVDLQIENAGVFSDSDTGVAERIDVVLDCSCNVLQRASAAASGLFCKRSTDEERKFFSF